MNTTWILHQSATALLQVTDTLQETLLFCPRRIHVSLSLKLPLIQYTESSATNKSQLVMIHFAAGVMNHFASRKRKDKDRIAAWKGLKPRVRWLGDLPNTQHLRVPEAVFLLLLLTDCAQSLP